MDGSMSSTNSLRCWNNQWMDSCLPQFGVPEMVHPCLPQFSVTETMDGSMSSTIFCYRNNGWIHVFHILSVTETTAISVCLQRGIFPSLPFAAKSIHTPSSSICINNQANAICHACTVSSKTYRDTWCNQLMEVPVGAFRVRPKA
jgi:hypothetical protein